MASLSTTNSVVVVGMGNPLLCDDAAGLLVTGALMRSRRFPQVTFKLNYCGGIDMLYDLQGYNKALIVDAIQSSQMEPGTCREFGPGDFAGLHQPRLVDSHGVSLQAVLDTGRRLGCDMPEEVAIVGIAGRVFSDFSESPTEQVKLGMDAAILMIEKKLNGWLGEKASSPVY